jgi:thiol-disulfide isomerase/thioredoxin
MVKARKATGLVFCSLLFWVGAAPAWAAPSVAQMLSYRPHQQGVAYSTPSAQDQEGCKVELVSGTRPNTSGWLLRDPKGLPLRRFFDSNGDGKVDIWSYFLDGVEVYREISSNFDGKADQFRWLNAGGMKWGVDSDQDGKIDYWKMISAEEVSQEILQAVVTHDFARLQALWITDADMKTLDMPAAEIARLNGLRDQAASKFQSTVAKLGTLGPNTRWERLESAGPQCVLAEHSGFKKDVLKYPRSMILYESSGKHDWIQSGEMIQVGAAWRLVDVPVPGSMDNAAGASQPDDPALAAQLEELRQLDAQAPPSQGMPNANSSLMAYNMKRAGLIERITLKVKPDEREQWVRQLADCLSAAAQSSPDTDRSAYKQLTELEAKVISEQPSSPLAAYVTFREMSGDYATKLAKGGPELPKVQEQWLARLAKFVSEYPKAEDAPDALLQLGMVSEFLGKETEAKKWYQLLASGFAEKKGFGDKAEGALRRLDLEGKPLSLAAATLDGQSFNIASLRGKVVIVYYWASWNQQCVGDFARLKVLMASNANKGVELVCVNLDNAPPVAGSPLDAHTLPGTQLLQPGGLESPLAVQYGIMVLPNMFLVGKDGNVASRNAQIATLEDELKRVLK